jgi:hypothetical protein
MSAKAKRQRTLSAFPILAVMVTAIVRTLIRIEGLLGAPPAS